MSALVIRQYISGEAVRRIDTSRLSESQRDRALTGLLTQLDSDQFYVEEED